MLHLYSVASDLKQVQILTNSAKNVGININIIHIENWKGYQDKIYHMKKVLSSLDNNDICCFVDAYDIIVYGDEKEIIRKYLRYEKEIVFGAELGCFPECLIPLYENNQEKSFTTQYRYLNSGGYIGRVDSLKKMLTWRSDEEIEKICKQGTDQYFYNLFYLDQLGQKNKTICLDIHQSIFQNICKVDFSDFLFMEGRLYNRILKELPAFVHLNGFKSYNDTLVHTISDKKENIMDVFYFTPLQTKNNLLVLPLFYKLPFFITYNNKIIPHSLPQI